MSTTPIRPDPFAASVAPSLESFPELQKYLTMNSSMLDSRAAMAAALQGVQGTRDINKECGYPTKITIDDYARSFARGDIASRVVSLYPDESWVADPEILENEKPKKTKFESLIADYMQEMNGFATMHHADVLSGVGRFGIILLGFNDGQALDEPVGGVDVPTIECLLPWDSPLKMEDAYKRGRSHKVLYHRVFSEEFVKIATIEGAMTSPRYGQPVHYEITLCPPEGIGFAGGDSGSQAMSTVRVHWTRVIHVSDHAQDGSLFSAPRMERVYERLLDIRKILSASAEMFWKGGFPGISFEMLPELSATGVIDKESLKREIEEYYSGLRRYLALQGMTAKSLAPQISNPTDPFTVQIKAIAITLGIPWRIFLGSEEAKLASASDVSTWYKRLRRRQTKVVTPIIIRQFVNRLLAYGALGAMPSKANGYYVRWPDIEKMSDMDKAMIAERKVNAIARYIESGAGNLISPPLFFSRIMDMNDEEVDLLMQDIGDRTMSDILSDAAEATMMGEGVGAEKKETPAKEGTPVSDKKDVNEKPTES